jgi:selenocysteine-specific elongation factor
MHVIGTAGHVDHGKSTLVQALTGINPDRLKEEQERQMTIDLGFAWLSLPGGEEVGVVDVPGHRDFIENMLAGVGGIDAAVLVIAADEGVMPQTREHLAILDLLDVSRCVVALTKVDLIEDPGWVELVRGEVNELLAPTAARGASIVPVSAVTGAGLGDLVVAIQDVLAAAPARPDLGRPRLPIDRVFTMAGFGTVVTGTLIDGGLEVGQEVEIQPSGLRGRIRGLQTHKEKVSRAVPGSRTAANLAGVEVHSLARGNVVTLPGTYRGTQRLDVRFRVLEDAPASIEHDQRAKLFLGSAQRSARIRLLGREELAPGEEGWLQLVLEKPIVCARGDRFILRQPSPGVTLGGGGVADAAPKRLHRRMDAAVLQRLERQLQGTPGEMLEMELVGRGPVTVRALTEESRLGRATAGEALTELAAHGGLVCLGGGAGVHEGSTIVMARVAWAGLAARFQGILRSYHEANPLRVGMPREELKSKVGLDARIFPLALARIVEEGVAQVVGTRIAIPTHEVVLSAGEQASVEELMARFRKTPYAPPSVKECIEVVGEEVLAFLVESGKLIQVSPDVVFDAEDYEAMVDTLRKSMQNGATITVAAARDVFDTSRKYVLALLEHLDAKGVTVREGDVRRLAVTSTRQED